MLVIDDWGAIRADPVAYPEMDGWTDTHAPGRFVMAVELLNEGRSCIVATLADSMIDRRPRQPTHESLPIVTWAHGGGRDGVLVARRLYVGPAPASSLPYARFVPASPQETP